MRIAIVDKDKCKHTRCSHDCFKSCPLVRSGKEVIVIPNNQKLPAYISEELCNGCGICVHRCPFKAIKIINTPERLDQDMIHRFGENSFALFRLPITKPNVVTGIIGQNGMGKSTALQILAGEVIPNFGDYNKVDPDWNEIIEYFKGTEIQNFFTKMAEKDIKCVKKPQYVDKIGKKIKGTVIEFLEKFNERNCLNELIDELGIKSILNREIKQLSGGELQKFAICIALEREADIYLFDEPSSFLDVNERIKVAKAIRKLATDHDKTVICVEHDLAILDYLSDYVCMLYGQPAAYGIVSKPHTVREGINTFLDGFLTEENVRFRETPIIIGKTEREETIAGQKIILEFPELTKEFENFKLKVLSGVIHENEVIGILGPNGIGKTTFVKILAGIIESTTGKIEIDDKLKIAHKPQYIATTESITVQEKLLQANSASITTAKFKSDVIKPFGIDSVMDQTIDSLSGGELQKVMIAYTLAQNADLYLFDEPSAYLSVEDRMLAAKIIHKHMYNNNKAAFVVEHDLVFQDYVSDKIMVFQGESSVHGKAYAPTTLERGMNRFLADLEITFRRDENSGRPRVNKTNSKLDRKQKEDGNYYYTKR